MYQAELKGKVSHRSKRSEDLLTSNVFSFFKYANRDVFLHAFLKEINVPISSSDLRNVEFRFWPSFEDKTEPDVVMIAGDYYLLFEAKYHSGFGIDEEISRNQIVREINGGMMEANTLSKELRVFAITSHAAFPGYELLGVPSRYHDLVRWINWQSIARILEDKFEEYGMALPNYEFSFDLYDLLDEKKLRGFFGFDRLASSESASLMEESLFFSPETAKFRGTFIGFSSVLSLYPSVKVPPKSIFFSRGLFELIRIKESITYQDEFIFWEDI